MKILIVGSEPSAIQVTKYKKQIIAYYDKIYCINNAWSLLKRENKIWSHSTDFHDLGTLFPTAEDKQFILEEITSFNNTTYWYDQSNLGSGTMFLNILYHIINENADNLKELEIHIIGNDFDYSNSKATHFYGMGKMTDETKELLKENTPELQNVVADPLRYGKENLLKELLEVKKIKDIKIFTLSSNKKQLLPYDYLNPNFIF